MSPVMASGKRLDHVHGLRGIAALMVVFQHAFEMAKMGGSARFDFVLEHLNLGRFGIVLFFLISGLVVPFSLHGERALRNFALSRFFRLYPAYWLSIALFMIIAFWQGAPIPSAKVLANLTMLQTLLGQANIGNAYWTLLYEMIFYAMCAALYAINALRSVPVIGTISAIGFASAIAPAIGETTGDVLVIPFIFGLFFLGMMLRFAFVEGHAAAVRWSQVLAPFAVLTGMTMGGTFFPVFENASSFFPPLALASAMAVPVLLFAGVLWLKPMPGKVLMYLGTISYSVYLFQQPVLDLLPQVIAPGEWPFGFALAAFGVIVAVSSLTYHWLEKPMQDLGRSLTRRAASNPDVVPPANLAA
jgi:peptidoglycan/LPS O-acetylase OafA/YrhL